eukprot:TRINITY_DN9490_c0_g1_i1.p1 TRINITY_DN9490_c0_g1~~TRINITY_DN9490_c0_g1_i1.p1  ORF type:complete len:138 (-),score=39.50 TRINITY_DN9490_c0_g1_i1:22-435(-)
MSYELIIFTSYFREEELSPEILHTNRVLQIGTGYAIFCADAVREEKDREKIIQKLKSTGREVITLSIGQMQNLCGQCHELSTKKDELLLVMSTRAYETLSPEQLSSLRKYVTIVHSPISTIEKIGGGSVASIINDLY